MSKVEKTVVKISERVERLVMEEYLMDISLLRAAKKGVDPSYKT